MVGTVGSISPCRMPQMLFVLASKLNTLPDARNADCFICKRLIARLSEDHYMRVKLGSTNEALALV